MDSGLFSRAAEVFLKARQAPAEQRDTFLDESCGGDVRLREEVERMLRGDSAPAPFAALANDLAGLREDLRMDSKQANADDHVPLPGYPPSAKSTDNWLREGPGTRIGRFRLLQLVGEGGFGVVYMAEQEQPVRRRVALKIIKLGMDTRQVVARFEAERQALAMMDHPNIAKVLDAGTTDTGRPYFVMELVKGVTITDYCDQNSLSMKERLDLFIQVCQAVQHAHQKGIIHRDLKPTNVLVTVQDGTPVPKVIDFGIAKATQARLTDQTLFTEYRQFIGTPEYMSPEQAEPSGLDVDTRSDIYSLGVLLYELLTGTTPFDPKELRSKAYGEIQRIIREVEPPRPSTRLSKLGGTLAGVAARRRTEPSRLGRQVRGDLDWVVMKCLEKNRTRRYETANALVMDLRRHLNDELVTAGPPAARHRLVKFMRRHRVGVSAAAAVAAALVLGTAGATVGLVRATRERDNAVHARAAELQQRQAAENAERERRRTMADHLMSAPPQTVLSTIDALKAAPGDVLPLLRARLDAPPAAQLTPERVRAASAMSILGESQHPLLVEAVAVTPAAESALLVAALQAATAKSPEVVADLSRRAEAENAPLVRARYASALLSLAQDGAARAMLKLGANPTPRTAFISEFRDWHGDLRPIPGLLRRVADDDFRSGLCAAVGRVAPQTLGTEDRAALDAALLELYRDSPSGGVHGAAAWALRQWRVPLPELARTPGPVPGRKWFVNRTGLTMVEIPPGFTVLGGSEYGVRPRPVLISRPYYMADHEIPRDLFREFADDPSVEPPARPVGWAGQGVAVGDGEPLAMHLSWSDAVNFCNWLSRREGRRTCYRRLVPPTEAGARGWECDPSADGYRLPTAVEWEYACRAGSTRRYVYADSAAWLLDYATFRLTDSRPGSRLPNGWGLSNTMGGVWEFSWDMPPDTGPFVDPFSPRPSGDDCGIHGGAFDSGSFDATISAWHPIPHTHRSSYGIRVICPAEPLPALAAPAYVAPGEARELWVRAAEYAGDDGWMWSRAAALRLHGGDTAAYAGACRMALAYAEAPGKTEATLGPGWYGPIALSCLLLPAEKWPNGAERADTALAVALARKAAKMGVKHVNGPWYDVIHALGNYRTGNPDAALNLLDIAATQLQEATPESCVAGFVRTLALGDAGRDREAQSMCAASIEQMQKHQPAVAAKDLGPEHLVWMICQVLRREAEEKLSATASP